MLRPLKGSKNLVAHMRGKVADKRTGGGNGREEPGVRQPSESGHRPGTVGSKSPESKGRLDRARVVLSSARPPKAPPLPRRLYDIQAVADYLGIPPYSVRGLIWNGSLPCVRLGRRQYVDLRDVDALIEANKVREVR